MRINNFAKWLHRNNQKIHKAVLSGIYTSANTEKNNLKNKSEIDTGNYKKSWKVIKGNKEVHLINTAKYAAILENGRRGFVGAPRPLQEWVQRKLGVPKGAAYVVARSIAAKGRKGNHNINTKRMGKNVIQQVKKELHRL